VSSDDDLTHSFIDSIVENIPDMVFVKDAAELRFQRLNRAGEALLGYPRQELLGKSDHDLFPREQADHFVAADRRVLQAGTLLEIAEEVIQTRNGLRILHTKKIPLRNAKGEITHLLGISEDITERKHADEERLLLLEERAARAAAEQASLDWSLLAQVSSQLAASLDLASSLFSTQSTMSIPRCKTPFTLCRRRDCGQRDFLGVANLPRVSRCCSARSPTRPSIKLPSARNIVVRWNS
jgi:PAS domain S-box-containing protein